MGRWDTGWRGGLNGDLGSMTGFLSQTDKEDVDEDEDGRNGEKGAKGTGSDSFLMASRVLIH